MEHSRRKKGLRIALAVLAVMLIGAAGYWSATRPLSVQAATVVRGTVQETLALDGDVVLDRQSLVVSTLNGRVRDLAIEEGDDVTRGDVLMRVESDRADAGTRTLEASREEARAMVGLAADDYAFASENYRRTERLYREGAVSEERLRTANSALDAAAGALRAARARLDQVDLQLEEARDTEDDQSIRATLTGRVLSVQVREDGRVAPGAALALIGDLSSRRVETSVLVDDMDVLDLDDPVWLEANYLEDAIPARIAWIAPRAQTAFSTLGVEQRRVTLHLTFDLAQDRLQPGYSVDCSVRTRIAEDAIVVDRRAVMNRADETSVFVVRDGIAERRILRTGLEGDRGIEVLEGLEEGERVILSPGDELADGTHVTVDKEAQS